MALPHGQDTRATPPETIPPTYHGRPARATASGTGSQPLPGEPLFETIINGEDIGAVVIGNNLE